MWPFTRAPAVHIRREYVKPSKLAEVMRNYRIATRLPDNHGTDPYVEMARARAFAGGPFRISPIASAEAPLAPNATGYSDRRRIWRFRACDARSGKMVWEKYVEEETLEGAFYQGKMELEQVLHTLGRPSTDGLLASVLAV